MHISVYLPIKIIYINDWRGGFQLVKVSQPYPPYNFDIHFVKESLKEYLTSTETADKYRSFRPPYANEVYGLNVYDLLINLCLQKKYDYRPFGVLKDHHLLMIKRLNYMLDKKYISNCQKLIDEYKKMTNLTQILLFKEIKCLLKPTPLCLENIIVQLQKIKSMDAQLVEEIIDKITGAPLYFPYQDLRENK